LILIFVSRGDIKACPLRLWAKGRFQDLRLEIVGSNKSEWSCGDRGIEFYDGKNDDDNKDDHNDI
jgi:hypothetical protein